MIELPVTHYPRRGDIFCANLEPVVGSEQGGLRPVLVIQNDTGNKYSATVIVAAITSEYKKDLPTHVTIPSRISGLKYNSIVLLEQIRTLDKVRLRDWVGHLPPTYMARISDALRVSVAV